MTLLWLSIILTVLLLSALVIKPSLAHGVAGRLLALVAVLVLPLLAAGMWLSEHVERSKTTQFCTSCHVMEPFGQSLHIDDVMHMPASHYQNGRVPRGSACFSCHTTYTMYGDFAAKLRGLRHVYVQYLGTIPSTIKLYSAYNNRECLHCHEGARSFEESAPHRADDGQVMARIKSNQLSCVSGECHKLVHDLPGLGKAALWQPK